MDERHWKIPKQRKSGKHRQRLPLQMISLGTLETLGVISSALVASGNRKALIKPIGGDAHCPPSTDSYGESVSSHAGETPGDGFLYVRPEFAVRSRGSHDPVSLSMTPMPRIRLTLVFSGLANTRSGPRTTEFAVRYSF